MEKKHKKLIKKIVKKCHAFNYLKKNKMKKIKIFFLKIKKIPSLKYGIQSLKKNTKKTQKKHANFMKKFHGLKNILYKPK